MLLSSMTDEVSVYTLGRKWLDPNPYYHTLRLTDSEVSTAIHYRTLSTSSLTTSPWCSKIELLGL